MGWKRLDSGHDMMKIMCNNNKLRINQKQNSKAEFDIYTTVIISYLCVIGTVKVSLMTTYSYSFSWGKIVVFWNKFHGIPGAELKKMVIIPADNGLVPIRLQAIIGNNGGLMYKRIHASYVRPRWVNRVSQGYVGAVTSRRVARTSEYRVRK